MKHIIRILLLVLVCAMAFAHEEVSRKELMRNLLPGIDRGEVTIHEGNYPPAWDSGWHQHPGDLYIYVLEGRLRVDFRDRDSIVADQGQLLLEPAGISNRALNLSDAKPLKLLLIHIAPANAELSIREE